MLQPYFEWMENLTLSNTIRDSVYIYSLDQAIHLVCLSVFAGAVLVVDLRLLGRGFSQQPVAQVAQDAQPWMMWGFLGLFLTGIPQLLGTAMKQYYSPMFWLKMSFMALAIIFTLTIRHKVAMADETRVGPLWGKLVGLVSIVLWAGVAIPARLIGLIS
jgi:hypothetical protein